MGRRKKIINKVINPNRVMQRNYEYQYAPYSFRVSIANPQFVFEKNKGDLLNMLLDLYYEKTLDTSWDAEIISEAFAEIKEVSDRMHKHSWSYMDKGNFIDKERYIYRFVCLKCGDYKKIEEKTLRQGVNDTVEEAYSEEPTKFAPPTHLSSVTSYKSSSAYE